MSASKQHRLEGLEPDNLLAFMALLGLLRALETAEPNWRPRAYWDDTRHPLRPVLTLAEAKTQEDVAAAAAQGTQALSISLKQTCVAASAFEIERCKREIDAGERRLAGVNAEKPLTERQKDDLKKALEKLGRRIKKLEESSDSLTDLARSHDELRRLTLSHPVSPWIACFSTEVFGANGWSALSTPLKFGSGQMPFAGALMTLTSRCTELEIERSLFGAWEYRHRGESLRLSPGELRLYAHRASDPSKKQATGGKRRQTNEPEVTGTGIAPSERGANSLAALAFLSFSTFAAGKRALAPGFVSEKGQECVRWPVLCSRTGPGFSRSAMEAVLSAARSPNVNASGKQSVLWMRARIVEVEDYKSITGARLETV